MCECVSVCMCVCVSVCVRKIAKERDENSFARTLLLFLHITGQLAYCHVRLE